MIGEDTQYIIETLRTATPWHVFLHDMGVVERPIVVLSVFCVVAIGFMALKGQVLDNRAYATVRRLRFLALSGLLSGAIYRGLNAWLFYGFIRTYAAPAQKSPAHILLPSLLAITYSLLVALIVWQVSAWALKHITARAKASERAAF